MNGRRGGGEGRHGSGGCEGWGRGWSVSACVFWFTLYFWPAFIACYLPPPGARPARGRARAAHREDVRACGAAVDQRLARSDQGA